MGHAMCCAIAFYEILEWYPLNFYPRLAKFVLKGLALVANRHDVTRCNSEIVVGIMHLVILVNPYNAETAPLQPYEQGMTFEQEQLQIGMKKIPEVRIVLENLFFATNETTILPESEPALNTLFEYLTKYPERTILIIGHTDNIGTIRANQTLSEGRANSVRQSMIDRGIAPERLQAEGHGELEPRVPNDSDEHRQMNRRVEFMVISDGAIDTKESTAPAK